MFRHPQLDTPRGRALQGFSNFFLHIYPVKIPKRVLRIRYSFRLGFIAAVLFGILLVTGVYLMFVYTPSVGSAYGDMQRLKTGVGFGQLIRNVHRWAAHLMVLVVAAAPLRGSSTPAPTRGPREFNWVLGVMLLLLTLAFSFTGYLLPWDQLAYWAVTVGTNLVHYVPLIGGQLQDLLIGGHQIGQSTLLRFYALHVAVLPALARVGRSRSTSGACARTASRSAARDVGAFAEEATARPAAGCCRPAAAPELYGGRVRLLGVVDRESVTAEERPVDDTVFTWPHLLVRHVVVALGVARGRARARCRVRRAAARPREPEPHARAGEGAVVLRRAPGAALPLRSAGRGNPRPARRRAHARAAAVHRPQSRDRGSQPQGRDRAVQRAARRSRSCSTVIGTFFRGPGWQFIAPWDHSYVEL